MSPRLKQTYDDTIAPDLMVLMYSHRPPGLEPPVREDRLRSWVGDSPYFENRARRGPRGGSALPLLKQPITFRNIPRVEAVTVHAQAQTGSSSAPLHVTGMALQAITNVRVTTHRARITVAQWNIQKGKFVSATATLLGEDMYHFLAKCVDIVLPRIKNWKGIKGSSGDGSGNISFGLSPEGVGLFPEIEVNYDM